MKKTQLLDARRNIRRELVAYLSIVIIGMLAAMAYLSVAYAAATLKTDALRFFNTQRLWDLELGSTLLMDAEDLAAIRALPEVETAEPVWQVDAGFRGKDGSVTVTVMSLPDTLSRPVLREGRLPETAGECAVEKELADKQGLRPGERIRVETAPVAGIEPLAQSEFVITGVFTTPDHITFMIPVTPYLLVPAESFNREGLDGAFMKTRVRLKDAPENRYGAAYRELVAPVRSALEALGEERAPLRRERMLADYQAQIDEGQARLDEAAEKLRLGQEKLDAGRRELESAAEQLGIGKELLDQGGDALIEARRLLDAAEAQLQQARIKLYDYQKMVNHGKDWLLEHVTEDNWPPDSGVSYEEFLQLVNQGGDALMRMIRRRSGYDRAVAEAEAANARYEAGRLDWYYSGEEYLDAVTRLEKGKRQIEEGERELAAGQAEYDEGERRLNEARAKLGEIGEGRWAVIDDCGNPGFAYAEANADKLASLSLSFSTIFLIVGALVIYATVGRMVEQQSKLIGATKAMGFYNREVAAKYLFFACSASLLGVALGVLASWLPLQRVILNSYEALLTYGAGTRSFLPLETGLVLLGALAIPVVAVFLGCRRLLRMSAIQLMQGTTPASGRKKAARSARGSLYSRLIFRNMRTDLSRVTVTIVSVAGGCLLMMVGFTLRYGIGAVNERQFGGVMSYEAEVFYDRAANPEAAEQAEAILDRAGLSHVRVRREDGVFSVDGTLNALTLVVAEKGSMAGYYDLKNIRDGAALELPDSGALVPRRFWEVYGETLGGEVPVYGAGLELRTVPIAGVFENYFGQLFFLTPQGYEQIFGLAPQDNCLLVRTGGMTLEQLRQELSGVEGVQRVADAAAQRTTIEQFTASLNFVVWFMLFIAAMMACFIVANFTLTYIQRKTRELTIMRINGFSANECIRYAALDLIVTTVAGTLLGLALGAVMGARILRITETPYIQMVRDPVAKTFLFSALATVFFSAVTNGLALRRIRKLKLSDID